MIARFRRATSDLATRLLALILLQVTGAMPGTVTSTAQAEEFWPPQVDIALVLAVDTSTSVDAKEFRLQMLGFANAFRHDSVYQAMRSGAPFGMAVAMLQWSGPETIAEAVPWTVLQSRDDMLRLADRLSATPRLVTGGRTALGQAVLHGIGMLDSVPVPARRRVVDVSGDGSNNAGVLPREARQIATGHGVTVNGLAILNEEPRLDVYYRSDLITGPGAFQISATDYVDFARAIRLKLVREIIGLPLAGNGRPRHDRGYGPVERIRSPSHNPATRVRLWPIGLQHAERTGQ